MSEHWRLLKDGPLNGARNMAADEALLNSVGAGMSAPVLRLYAWQPACLSLGYAQSGAEVDRVRLASRGWHAVRRMSGGRAILHTDELTYSVTLPLDHPLAAGGIIESYRRLSSALLDAVQAIGLAADAEKRAERSGKRPGPVCFEVPSDYEITAVGKKLIGSAQVRRQGAMLQHGTLPLTGDLRRICEVLTFQDEAERTAARERVLLRATTLSEAVGRPVSWDQAARAVIDSFARCFEIQFEASTLSETEEQDAALLEADRYLSDGWTFKA